MFKILHLILLFACFSFQSTAIASDWRDSTATIQPEIKGMVLDLRDRLIPAATHNERSIIQNIKIKVPIDPKPARVGANNSQHPPVIEISTGFVAVIHQISRAYMIGLMFGKPTLGYEFTKYAATRYTYPTSKKLLLPENLAHISLTKQQQKKVGQAAFGLQGMILMHVLAHEIAHVIYNHKIDKGSSKNAQLSMSRDHEEEADAWASDILCRAGMPPYGGIYAFLYWYFVDQTAINHEDRRDHPAEVRRIKALADSSIDAIDQWWPKIHAYFPRTSKESLEHQLTSLSEDMQNKIEH